MLLWCSLLLIVWIDGWLGSGGDRVQGGSLHCHDNYLLPLHLSRFLQTQMCFERSWETFKTVKQQKREHRWYTRGTEI